MSRTYDIFAFLNWKRLMCNYSILQTEQWARWMKNSEFSKNWNWCCAQKRINCTAPESEDLFAAQFQGTVKRNTEMARFFLQRVCRKVNSHINMCAFAHGCGFFESWYFLQYRISRNGYIERLSQRRSIQLRVSFRNLADIHVRRLKLRAYKPVAEV